jgi:hypothetical protein
VAEKLILLGIIPEVIALDPGDQAVWYSNVGSMKIEFDPQRSPFNSNVFQAPAGVRLSSGPSRPGVNPGSYRYRLFLNDSLAAQGEVLIREKPGSGKPGPEKPGAEKPEAEKPGPKV